MRKLLLIGSTSGSVHIKNYYELVKDYFDDILIVSAEEIDFCKHKKIDFSLKNPLKIFKSIYDLRTIMKAYQPTIIHVHQANSYGYITAKANKAKYPLVLTTWGSDVLLLPSQGMLYRHIVKYTLKKANYITADAHFMAKAIEQMGIKKEVVIANFGIDIADATIPEKENIIYSNRLHNDLYNIEQIIDVFAKFYATNKDWKLVVGARGNNTDKLKDLAQKMLPRNAYEFIGFVDKEENIKQYLKAKIWVSIPSSDGTAISLLEAMAYGCIPVVSDLPANKEWVENNKNGCIVQNDLLLSLNIAKELPISGVQKINKDIITNKATKAVNREKFLAIYDAI